MLQPMSDFSSYLSPFSWRYGSPGMRGIWSEEHKRRLWRKLWCGLARVESRYGLVTAEQVAELAANAERVDMRRAHEIEAEIRHDLMAEVKTYAEQCPLAGGVIHLGATSMDIEDNCDALRMREALDLIMASLGELLGLLADRIEENASQPVMAFTHLQPAEPTTFGYRLAVWTQDLLINLEDLQTLRPTIKGKGFRGAVGTGASYAELLGAENVAAFEERMEEELGIGFFPIATQTYTRLQDYRVVSALAGVAASLHKMAFDLRVLQSPPVGEVSEPFGARQIGSSAMPFKRNPIDSEKIDSLSRLLAGMPQLAWSNAALSLLERTLDDSANRRTMLPEAFLACDEILKAMKNIVKGFVPDRKAMRRTFEQYGPFACTERVLMAMAKAGADRQETHEKLREHSLEAWAKVKDGLPNTLGESIRSDPYFLATLDAETISSLMNIDGYFGDCVGRALEIAGEARRKARTP